MRDLIAKRNKRGFTVAELLIVIAILVILIGLGVPGFLTLRKNIQIAKYDDIAREIYVAAQNQLTRLAANGLYDDADNDADAKSILNNPSKTVSMPSDYTGANWVAADYHYANKSDPAMDLLLPLGAVSDDLRTNGHYVIEYNARTYTVYAVFYAEKGFDYPDVANTTNDAGTLYFRSSREVRKIPMVGYYGGSSVVREEQATLDTPKLEIINNDELRLNILDVPDGVTVSVTVSDGVTGHTPYPVNWIQDDGANKTALLDGMKTGDHFHERFKEDITNGLQALTPGKDLTITVTYTKGLLTSSASVTANSLFATREPNGGVEGKDAVTIAWARHLQNLHPGFSELNDATITLARQTDNIQWKPEFGSFASIENANLKRYQGSNLEIRDLYSTTNGLFANANNKELAAICIVNPTITASGGSVGVLAGTVSGTTTITGCGVYCRKVNDDKTVNYGAYAGYGVTNTGDGATGGLVGSASGAAITNSFAALPFINAKNGAALIGSAANCTITNSYANCDTLPTENFAYFLNGTGGNMVQHCYAVGNVANDKPGVFAGGTNAVTDSYYAVAHRQYAALWENNADLAVTEFRYIASGDWQETNQEGMAANPLGTGWSNGQAAPLTHPYREHLDSRAYPYPAIGALDHYGSWPDGDGAINLKITMQLLNNEEAGYAIFAGKVVVEAKDKDGNITTIFDSDTHKDSDGNFDGKDTVPVMPGTDIKITVTDVEGAEGAKGYEYVHTKIGNEAENRDRVLTYTVKKDTEAVVTFQQNTFKLSCDYSKNDLGHGSGSYLAVLGDSRVVRPGDHDDKVETGTTITIKLAPEQGYQAAIVWYTHDDDPEPREEHMVVPNDQGNYAFPMPSADATIHVKYTQNVARFKVQYYVRDPNTGEYPEEPTSSNSVEYAIGTKITRDVVDILAENSGRILTRDGIKVMYLESAVLSKKGTTFFQTITDTSPYDTSHDPNGTEFILKIMITRKQTTVTLKSGENIQRVYFKDIAGKEDPKTISVTCYYGKTLTAAATVNPGLNFTTWEPDPEQKELFRSSSSIENTIEVPYFDLTLTARAIAGSYQVTLNLQENEESWLAGSPSRQADPIGITLENTQDAHVTYEMTIPDKTEEISYIAQANIVKSIPEISQGYKIKVIYASGLEEYAKNPDGSDRIITVRDRAVEEELDFYTVTYYPNVEVYRGTVPKGGTYLQFHKLTVPGNVGNLRNTDPNNNKKVFAGWYDAGVEAEGIARQEVTVGDTYTVTRRTDFFANWQTDLKVMYNANDEQPPHATGELPVDSKGYADGELVTVKKGSLTRPGYAFLGWSTDRTATTAQYQSDDTFEIGGGNVTLYAVWHQEEYTLTFRNPDETVIQTIEKLHYGDRVDAPGCEATDGSVFLGWAAKPFGEVAYPVGSKIQVTGNQTFYPRFDTETVEVTYHYDVNALDDPTKTQTVRVGKGISFYLNCEEAGDITAWRTQDSKTFYLCEDGSARSLETVSFTADIHLYAVTGRVYNFNRQLWYNTLYDAVKADATQAGDTLIVYRDTTETNRISFTENLHILANGNRRVTWNTANGSNAWDVFCGCMYVKDCAVSFGKSDIDTLSMDGSSLTFDANHLTRVIALDSGAELDMHSGVTLTDGLLVNTSDRNAYAGTDVPRQFCGGGLYAGVGSVFNMRGGTISYSTSFRGGGVYLYGNKESQDQGAKMYMGAMEHPTAYSATAIHYIKEGKYYKNVDRSLVTLENYRDYYVATGDPEICYNEATNAQTDFGNGDGGGGLLMLDLPDGYLELYKGSITNNSTSANGGGIVTDGGGKNGNTDLGNEAQLRIYEVDISHNSAAGSGGGIFQWQGVVYIYNSTIRQNHAGINGGGIYLHHYGNENSDVDFYFGDIADNEAGGEGGGVYVEGDLDIWIRNGNLCRNKAGKEGGGILAGVSGETKTAHVYLSGGSIYDNIGNRNRADGDQWKDKNSDIYLRYDTVITVLEGGLHLNMNNPGQQNDRIYVDGWPQPGPEGAYKRGGTIVEYNRPDDFKAEDADLFWVQPLGWYWANNASWWPYRFQILPTKTADKLGPPLILWDYGDTNMQTRTLEFYKNDGSVDADGKPIKVEKPVKVGDLVTDFPSATSTPPFTREGYYIGGWAREPDAYEEDYVAYYNSVEKQWYTKYEVVNGKAQWTDPADTPTYTVDEKFNQRFYAMWKPYVVRYNLNNAPASVGAMEEGIGPKVQLMSPNPDHFDRDDVTYSFRGWSTDANAKTPDYVAGEKIDLKVGDMTLYAVWRPNVVKFTFNFNDGVDVDGKFWREETVIRGEPYTIPEIVITKNKKGFAGWSTEPTATEPDPAYAAGEIINTVDDTEDLTLYAVWKDLYTAVFHQNYGSMFSWEKSVVQGGSITQENPIREGYIFKGWAETEGGEVTYPSNQASGQISITPDKNLELYAVWEEGWTVTFDYNDEGTTQPVTRTVAKGESIVIDLEDPTRQGYTFGGWSDGTTIYQKGGSTGPVNADIALTAQWTPVAVTKVLGAETLTEESAATLQGAAPEPQQATDETAQQ